MSWLFSFTVALLAFLLAVLGRLGVGRLVARLRGAFGLLALAAGFQAAAQTWAPGSSWERWASVLELVALAYLAARVALYFVFDWFLLQRVGVRPPRLTRDVMSALVVFLVVAGAVQAATGTDLRTFLATSAVITLVLGLALQETLGNLFAGLALLGDRRLEEGRWVEGEGILGQVEELTWRAVVLRTRLGERVLVPNTSMARGVVRVLGSGEPVAVTAQVSAAYGVPPAQVKQRLQELALDTPGVLADPTPQVFLASFGDSAVQYECRLWTGEPWRRADLLDSFLTRVWYAFQREGWEIPFPQRTLHWATPSQRPGAQPLPWQILANSSLFAGLPENALEKLAAEARLLVFAPGEAVVREGEASRALYVLAKGKARVEKGGRKLAHLEEGEVFGEIAFLTGRPRAATVRAEQEVWVMEVGAEALAAALHQWEGLAGELASRMAARQAEIARLEALEAVTEAPRSFSQVLAHKLRQLVRVGRATG